LAFLGLSFHFEFINSTPVLHKHRQRLNLIFGGVRAETVRILKINNGRKTAKGGQYR